MYRDDFTKKAEHGGLHGDVGLVPISKLPANAKSLKGNKIALGEQTGHHHILDIPGVQLYEVAARELDPKEVDTAKLIELFGSEVKVMLAVTPAETEAPLRHQEHGTQIFAPGVYFVPHQFEFPLGQPVKVQD